MATRQETIKRNNEIIQAAHAQRKETLCWLCKKACGTPECHCNKSMYGLPVDGWEATENIIHYSIGDYTAWNVKKCPEFEFDWNRPQELADLLPILIDALQGDGTREAIRRSIYRHPQQAVVNYNKLHPELQLILDTDEE